MSTDMLIANMLRIAREDLDGARVLGPSGNRNAIYLCEQAAEKVIRAVLTSEGKHAGIRHHLEEMVDQVPDENPLKTALREIEDLAAFATSYRYPTTVGRISAAPTIRELEEWIQKVEFALREAASRLGVDVNQRGQPAARPGPIR